MHSAFFLILMVSNLNLENLDKIEKKLLENFNTVDIPFLQNETRQSNQCLHL